MKISNLMLAILWLLVSVGLIVTGYPDYNVLDMISLFCYSGLFVSNFSKYCIERRKK